MELLMNIILVITGVVTLLEVALFIVRAFK